MDVPLQLCCPSRLAGRRVIIGMLLLMGALSTFAEKKPGSNTIEIRSLSKRGINFAYVDLKPVRTE